MSRLVSALSKGMLILGGILILAGLGWGIWLRVINKPPDPVLSDAGAVVFAMTAPVEPTATATIPPPSPTTTPSPSPTEPEPTRQGATDPGATPDLLPGWTATPSPPEPTPTIVTATPEPPTPTPRPTATPLPVAEDPPTHIVSSAVELDGKVKPMGWEQVEEDGTMVAEWVVPKKAAGWHENSALPGHGGNVVISGHHNVSGKVFRYVVDLVPGDEITLYVEDTPYFYTVTEKYILREEGMSQAARLRNAQWIKPTDDERLTLVTCWPYDWPGNSHRVIVVAKPPVSLETRDVEPR